MKCTKKQFYKLLPAAISIGALIMSTCRVQGDEGNKTTHRATSIKPINSFEDVSLSQRLNFLDGLSVENAHVTHGQKSIKLTTKYVLVQEGQEDWTGYDYLMVDLFVPGSSSLSGYVEIRDNKTDGYWTRVNYSTVFPPGKSTLKIPLDQLYVGEKSRPGRKLNLKAVTKVFVGLRGKTKGEVYLDNVRLEKDLETAKYTFDGLHAFDFGKTTSPLMPGFTRIDPSSRYQAGVGYGLKDARIWRTYDVLQPEPLYQDFICIERGGLALDLPNGKYLAFVNMDNPSGYWGEYQTYTERKLLVEGQEAVVEKMTYDTFMQKYFRHWLTEDTPRDNTFEKYQEPYFNEHLVTVDVKDGQLNIEFEGKDWACSVSAVVVFPASQEKKGRRFLAYVKKQRKALFEQGFRRVLHKPTGTPIKPDARSVARGYIPFVRDYAKDVYYNDRPSRIERTSPVIKGEAFAGEHEPMTVSFYALSDLESLSLSISDLSGPSRIPSDQIAVGYVSNRISRESMDGSVYTIKPRLVIPRSTATVSKHTSRRFWMTVRVPKDAAPGMYEGTLEVTASNQKQTELPVQFRVYKGTLDPVDIPVGPWGHAIRLPWLTSDPKTQKWQKQMAEKSLNKLKKSGFTTFSGMPALTYNGFKNGEPVIDFTKGDEQMRMARRAGFTMPIVSYVGIKGLKLYYQDQAAMTAAGFKRYDRFIGKVFRAIQKHADKNNWLPIYWNIGDEPMGESLTRSIENAKAYRKAFPKGPPFFTAATSFRSGDVKDKHFTLAKTLHVANFNGHNKHSINLLHKQKGKWAFYNQGRRWTYGIYLFKAAKKTDLKFRISWHWNVVAGDPYYALDCREDDYAWANAGPKGELVTSVKFEREMREGIDDYRYLLTLSNLAKRKNDRAALSLIESRLKSFELGDTDVEYNYRRFRQEIAAAIERLRQ